MFTHMYTLLALSPLKHQRKCLNLPFLAIDSTINLHWSTAARQYYEVRWIVNWNVVHFPYSAVVSLHNLSTDSLPCIINRGGYYGIKVALNMYINVLKCYVLLTVHLGILLVNEQLDAQFFHYMFISILYMFRATLCSSSGESIVSIQHQVYVNLKVSEIV
jgi:hypothetical protein